MNPVGYHTQATTAAELFTFCNYPAPFAVCSTTHKYEDAIIATEGDLVELVVTNTMLTEKAQAIEDALTKTAKNIEVLFTESLRSLPNVQVLPLQKEGADKLVNSFEFTLFELMSGYAYFYKDGNIRELDLVFLDQGVTYEQHGSTITCTVTDPDIIALTFEANEPTQIMICDWN